MKYCSNKCRHEGHKLTEEEKIIECPVCKNQFMKKKAKQKYCCRSCAVKGGRWTEQKKEEIIRKNTGICEYCKKEFKKRNKNQKYCSLDCSRHTVSSGSSKENKHFWKLLTQLKFKWVDEFYLWWYYYDFKIGDILIELNPYAFHNSTFAPKIYKNIKPKDKMYHYNKYKCAIDNWYKCIMVWDWTNNLIDMITNEQFHYEWLPQLHYYNPKTKGHIIRKNRNKSRIDKWFVEIRDCGKETF